MHITPDIAMQRISSQGGGLTKRSMSLPLEFVRSVGIADESVFLIRRGTEGFVAPADDTLTPCIGESEEVDYTVDLPPCYEEMLNDYAKEVEWWQTIGYQLPIEAAVEENEKAVVAKDISALIKTKWNQTAPWNQNLKFEGKSCYVGCVPLSIGQLLYYWAQKGFRRGCMASAAYKTKTNLYEVAALPPVTVFDYDHMVTGKPTTAQSKKAVADMLQQVGHAVKADYKPTSTGADQDYYIKVLASAFRLGSSIKRIYASKLGLASFMEQVRLELAAGRPVMICGSNSSNKGRHAFLCDGYRESDGLFHFNWGWGGAYDGYFKMGALTPASSRDYSYYKTALINIQPEYMLGDANRDGQVDISDVITAVDHSVKGTYSEAADVNSDGKVDIEDAQTMVNAILGKEKL